MKFKKNIFIKIESKLAHFIWYLKRRYYEIMRKKDFISVLCFHDVSDEVNDTYSITKNCFKSFLNQIDSKVYSIDELAHGAKNGLVLTFDDGYSSLFEYVYPLLKSKNIPFTAYIVTDRIGKTGYMNAEQLRLIAQDSDICTIGSHMCTHRKTREMSDDEIFEEWKNSRNILENITGKKIIHGALPYGSVESCSRKSILLGLRAGYNTISTTSPVLYRKGNVIPRFVFQNNKPFSFTKLIEKC